jgi:methylglutaconyl-CoA hydratase
MSYTTLVARRDGAIERLTLNRPDVRNAFNDTMIAELTAWAAHLHTDADVRVAVIDGAGKSFSAGADITWMAQTIRYSREDNLRDATDAARMFAAINTLPIPVVGRVHGAAIGGGAGLAAVCDVVVAEEQAVFGFTEVKLGIVPAVISPFVLEKIGRSAARELFLTGARFSAARAKDIGLIHAVVPSNELDATVAQYVADLLTGGREAIAAAKTLIADVSNASPGATEQLTSNVIATRRVSAEGQEGLTAFLEKRTPGWVRS